MTGTTILHGTTAGTNALIQEKGARTALVTTSGFEDLLEIGRQARPSLYDPLSDRPAALSPRDLRFGYSGDVEAIGALVEEADVEAVAVALVRSYLDPSEEIDLARSTQGPDRRPGLRRRRHLTPVPRVRANCHHRSQRLSDAGASRLFVPSRRRGRWRKTADDDLIGWVAPLRRCVGATQAALSSRALLRVSWPPRPWAAPKAMSRSSASTWAVPRPTSAASPAERFRRRGTVGREGSIAFPPCRCGPSAPAEGVWRGSTREVRCGWDRCRPAPTPARPHTVVAAMWPR